MHYPKSDESCRLCAINPLHFAIPCGTLLFRCTASKTEDHVIEPCFHGRPSHFQTRLVGQISSFLYLYTSSQSTKTKTRMIWNSMELRKYIVAVTRECCLSLELSIPSKSPQIGKEIVIEYKKQTTVIRPSKKTSFNADHGI